MYALWSGVGDSYCCSNSSRVYDPCLIILEAIFWNNRHEIAWWNKSRIVRIISPCIPNL